MKIIRPSILAALAALVSSPDVHAVVVIDNLTVGPNSFATSISGPVGGGILAPPPNRESAFSFVTGSSQAYLSVLELSANVSNNSVGLQATISTGSSVPGGTGMTLIGTVTPVNPTPITQLLTFTPGSTILLDASTRYWIHLTVASGSGSYSLNNTTSQIIEPGWTLENTHYLDPGGWTELDSGPQARMRLTVTPVPEAGCPMLCGFGMLLLCRRRR
jgi:hypothetical protein